MNKKITIIGVLCLMVCTESHTHEVVSGKSFFGVSPLFYPTAPSIIALNRPELKAHGEIKRNSLEVVVLASRSTDSDAIARYFLPFGKKTLLCGELGSQAVLEGRADVIANYFGVLTSSKYSTSDNVQEKLSEYTFESELTFAPTQASEGFCVSLRRHLSECLGRGWWVEIDIPFMWVRNDMHLHEKIITPGGPNGNDPEVPEGYVGNMKEAFAGDVMNWRFGRIKGPLKEAGLADIFVRFGYTDRSHETRHIEGYVGAIVPTGNTPKSEFVFEPIVGNHRQMGAFFGTSIGFELWSQPCCDRSLYWELDTTSTFYSTVRQTRSFDLKNNVWSRYIWVYRSPQSTDPSPGINVFTHLVDVEPGSTRDLNTAYVFKQGGFVAELGYHFAGTGAEKLSLVQEFKDEVALAAITQLEPVPLCCGLSENHFVGNNKLSRNSATINHYLNIGDDTNAQGVEVYKNITVDDFDFDSATQPTHIVHTTYATLGYHWVNNDHPRFCGVGGAYDYVPDNTAIRRWYIWGMFDISF